MEKRIIPFRGWDIIIIWLNGHNADARFAVKPLCEAIGLDWKSQHAKIMNDPKFNHGYATMVAEDGRQRAMTTLPV